MKAFKTNIYKLNHYLYQFTRVTNAMFVRDQIHSFVVCYNLLIINKLSYRKNKHAPTTKMTPNTDQVRPQNIQFPI